MQLIVLCIFNTNTIIRVHHPNTSVTVVDQNHSTQTLYLDISINNCTRLDNNYSNTLGTIQIEEVLI